LIHIKSSWQSASRRRILSISRRKLLALPVFKRHHAGAKHAEKHRRGLAAVGVAIKTGQKSQWESHDCSEQPGLASSFAWLTKRRESCNYEW